MLRRIEHHTPRKVASGSENEADSKFEADRYARKALIRTFAAEGTRMYHARRL